MHQTISHITSILLCVILFVHTYALNLVGTYDNGPVNFTDDVNFWFNIDLDARTAKLAVHVKDSATINSDSSAAWIGLGISESSSGSMLGADIVTAQFSPSQVDECTIVDRHVPFVAYPLLESTADSQSVFPEPDDCQGDGSWVLVRCERDSESAEIVLEVTRSLDAHDTQDRNITEGLNSVIYAYGQNFQYHGSRRGSQRVKLYTTESGETPGDKLLTDTPQLPDDVEGSFEVLATNYTVPSASTAGTIYSCTSSVFDLGANGKRMIIAAEPVLNSTIDMIHHFTLYLCSGKEYADKVKSTVECTTDFDNGITGPIGNPEAKCHTLIYVYVKGAARLVLPREAGIVANKDKKFLIMETHFDNPDAIKGNIDNSGVRIYYTDTMRDNEAASLLIGDQIISRFSEVIQSGFKYQHTCPSECTSKFNRTINIFSSVLHMHTTGKEIYTNKFSANGSFVENIGKVNFWSDRFQQITIFDPPATLSPGEQLQTTCLYDTSKRPDTKWGFATTDEMCMDFIGYWPAQEDPTTGDEINTCSYWRADDATTTGTICGDNGNIRKESIILKPNPKFNDTIGAPTTFGDDVETCPTRADFSPEPTSMAPAPNPSENGDAGGETSTMPSSTPSDNDSAEEENTCFPASATVTLKDGSVKRMDEVLIGDEILVGPETFSKVFMFTHRDSGVRFSFVEIESFSGRKLRLTSGHFIYANELLVEAASVVAGDDIILSSGETDKVVRVDRVTDVGLFNPQTLQGDILVDGVRTSTYTRAVSASIAHGLLVPLRYVHRLFALVAS